MRTTRNIDEQNLMHTDQTGSRITDLSHAPCIFLRRFFSTHPGSELKACCCDASFDVTHLPGGQCCCEQRVHESSKQERLWQLLSHLVSLRPCLDASLCA